MVLFFQYTAPRHSEKDNAVAQGNKVHFETRDYARRYQNNYFEECHPFDFLNCDLACDNTMFDKGKWSDWVDFIPTFRSYLVDKYPRNREEWICVDNFSIKPNFLHPAIRSTSCVCTTEIKHKRTPGGMHWLPGA